MDIQILPEAFGHLRKLEEIEVHRLEALNAKKADKRAERKWSLFMFAMGVAATIFTLWIKSTFFP